MGLRVSWDGDHLVSWLAAPPRATDKSALPLWSPAHFRGDHRALANVDIVHALVMDIDQAWPTVDALEARMAQALPRTAWWCHTSHSSEAGALRMRVVVQLSRPMTPAEHRTVWRIAAQVLVDAGIEADRACSDASRAYFVPAVPLNGCYAHRVVVGDPLDVDMVTGEAAALDAAESAAVALHVPAAPDAYARAMAYAARVPGAIEGAGGSVSTFTLAMTLVQGFALDEADALAILRQWNAKCVPPWTERELAHKVQSARRSRAERGFMLVRGSR